MARHIAIFGLACALASPAFAQAPPQAKPPVTPPTESNSAAACANAQATIGQGGDVQVNGQDKAKQDKSLSDKLAKSNGVICPPDHVDPDMKQPTPPGGPMPVIPPPGTPGGDQSVQPK